VTCGAAGMRPFTACGFIKMNGTEIMKTFIIVTMLQIYCILRSSSVCCSLWHSSPRIRFPSFLTSQYIATKTAQEE
jgi:hypothetical protein